MISISREIFFGRLRNRLQNKHNRLIGRLIKKSMKTKPINRMDKKVEIFEIRFLIEAKSSLFEQN